MDHDRTADPHWVVLDTNVVLDLLHFHDPGAATLDAAIRSGRVHVITDSSCLEELRRVLAYPAFGLGEDAQETLRAAYAAIAKVVEPGTAQAGASPRCTDADDQKFIDLALRCRARFLISKDRAVLRLARRFARTPGWSGCAIVEPRAFTLPA